jgi:2-C-methyl-D-erythritol 4-phosphate cytidylyltransferase
LTLSTSAQFVALIPAGGVGARVGGATPKQYLPVLGQPMIAWAAFALASHPRITQVAVVVGEHDELAENALSMGVFENIAEFLNLSAPLAAHVTELLVAQAHARCRVVYKGGTTRADTVRNGLVALDHLNPHDWVLVHDAARPGLTHALINRLIATATPDNIGALLAMPVPDTVKRANADNQVAATLPRTGLWGAQTPQMFRHSMLLESLRAAAASTEITDEASAIEAAGHRPLLVPGALRNLKVTFPDDIATVEALMSHAAPKGIS